MSETQVLVVVLSVVVCLLTRLAEVSTASEDAGRQVVVSVDSARGDDTICHSFQELQAGLRFMVNNTNATASPLPPCRTLNRALGDVDCYNSCKYREINRDPLLNVVVYLSDGVHRLSDCIAIDRGQNVTIEAMNYGEAVVECAHFPENVNRRLDGVRACHTEGLTFKGVRFEKCGQYSPAVFLNRTSKVAFEDSVFAFNYGAPLWTQFVSSITLIRTKFIHNQNQIPADVDNENTTIDLLYVSITTSGAFTFYSRDVPEATIVIENCTFYNNSAGTNSVNNSRPVLLKANGHGGAVLARLAKVKNASISISNSYFERNFAEVDGGAVYFSFSETFSSSSVSIENCQFLNNTALQSSGGAISMNFYRGSFNNNFFIQRSVFENNQADSGGAVGLALYDTTLDSIDLPDSAVITNCSFYGNSANKEGTAVGLFSLVHVDESGFPVEISNCTFKNNYAIKVSADHVSALVSFRFPMHLSGFNHFVDNVGGGISLLNSAMTVSGELLFDSNIASYGAGMSLDDICKIELSPGVNLTFANNFAEESGGGIHVEFPAIRYTTTIFNRLCFLEYNHPVEGRDIPPQEWKDAGVSITFINNSAGLSGAAIYASDLRLCSWVGNDYPIDLYTIFELPQEIAHLSPFSYINNSLKSAGQKNVVLATAPHQILVEPEHYRVQPGERLPLTISVKDQVNNSREAIWSVDGPRGDAFLDGISATTEVHFYDVPKLDSLVLGGRENCTSDLVEKRTRDPNFVGNFSLTFTLPGTLGLTDSKQFNFTRCHPGYVLDPVKCICICDMSQRDIVRCDTNTSRYIYLRSGVWGGVELINSKQTFVTANVLPSYIDCSQEGRLPGCLVNTDTDRLDDQCRPGRHGRLCGLCNDGYGVTLDLQACTPSSSGQCAAGLALFIFLCLLVVIVSLLILLFNVEVPNELKGFIFYAQVIGLVYRPFVAIQTTESAIDPLGTILNLLGFSVPISLCISSSLRAHHAALLGYISPLLALFTVLGYLLAARFIKPLGNRSALKGITFLFLFIYKYIADTSFVLISCNNTQFGLVFQYDGTLSCTGIEFGLFVLIGLTVVVFFVAPAPFAVGYVCRKRPQRFQHYADILTKGLRKSRRWFGGWDIGRRLPFVFFGYFLGVARPSLVLFLMTASAMFVLMTHVLTKPYVKTYINIIETLILLNLAAVTVIYLNPSANSVPQWLSTLLVVLPYVYCIVYILWRIARYIWQKLFTSKFKEMAKQKLKAAIGNRELIQKRNNSYLLTPSNDQQMPESAYVAFSRESEQSSGGSKHSDLLVHKKESTKSGNSVRTSDDELRESLLQC